MIAPDDYNWSQHKEDDFDLPVLGDDSQYDDESFNEEFKDQDYCDDE